MVKFCTTHFRPVLLSSWALSLWSHLRESDLSSCLCGHISDLSSCLCAHISNLSLCLCGHMSHLRPALLSLWSHLRPALLSLWSHLRPVLVSLWSQCHISHLSSCLCGHISDLSLLSYVRPVLLSSYHCGLLRSLRPLSLTFFMALCSSQSGWQINGKVHSRCGCLSRWAVLFSDWTLWLCSCLSGWAVLFRDWTLWLCSCLFGWAVCV